MDHKAEHAAAEHAHHGPSLKLLAATLFILLILTWVTVAATWFNLGSLNLWVALIIATIKGALVALIFMHLRYEKPFNAVILLASLAFTALFIGASLQDSTQYQPDIRAFRQVDVQNYAPTLYRNAPAPAAPAAPHAPAGEANNAPQ